MPTNPNEIRLTIRVNGKKRSLKIDPRESLLDLARERLGLTGSKKGCDHGQCGACTMLVDGARVNSCLCLAAQYEGAEVLTIEGLAKGEEPKGLHPLQRSFLERDAYQCGFCTPGQIMSALGFLQEGGGDLEEGMSGNICRCGAYCNIREAIRDVQADKAGGKSAGI